LTRLTTQWFGSRDNIQTELSRLKCWRHGRTVNVSSDFRRYVL